MSSKQDQEATLISHLEALRRALLRSIIALAIGIVPLFLVSPYVLDWFCEQIALQGGVTLHYFSPMEVFLLQLKISALLDCVLFSPYIAWNMWQFVLPALYDNEKRFIRSIVAMTSGLVIAGVAFCLVVCFPLIVQFGMSFASTTLQPVFGVSNLVTLALWLSLAFGCMFQFPLVTYALIRAGIVNYETVCSKRPYVVVAILVLAALLTPPDVVSQLLLGLPTYLLFEAGLLAARRYKGRALKEVHPENAPNIAPRDSTATATESEPAQTTATNESVKDLAETDSPAADNIDFAAPSSKFQVGAEKGADKWKPY